jgi:hypothetical protein
VSSGTQVPFALSALVLTEDSASDAFTTVRLLVKHLLQVVDPKIAVQRIDFEPATDEHVKRACIANRWKSTAMADQPARIALIREIAGKLREPGGFVFFHFDGDTVWSNRNASENVARFSAIIEDGVRETLRMRLLKPAGLRQAGTLSEEEIEGALAEAMPKLVQVVPHYSIEAWCFQNTALARRICASLQHDNTCRQCDDWEADRGLLDELKRPKDRCCLYSDHNKTLAGPGFPRDEAFKADKSFASVAVTMCNCTALTSALRETYIAEECGDFTKMKQEAP